MCSALGSAGTNYFKVRTQFTCASRQTKAVHAAAYFNSTQDHVDLNVQLLQMAIASSALLVSSTR
jgi:hypothetical protein